MASRFSRALTAIPGPAISFPAASVSAPVPNPAETLNKLVNLRIALWLAEAALPVKEAEEINKLIEALLARGALDVNTVLTAQAAFEVEKVKLDAQKKSLAAAGVFVEHRIAELATAAPSAAAEVAKQFRSSLDAEVKDHNDKVAAITKLSTKIHALLGIRAAGRTDVKAETTPAEAEASGKAKNKRKKASNKKAPAARNKP